MKIIWKDISSYSQSDKERIPHAFQIGTLLGRIVVHRLIHCEGWFVSLNGILNNVQLISTDVELAKVEALEKVYTLLDKAFKEIAEISGKVS